MKAIVIAAALLYLSAGAAAQRVNPDTGIGPNKCYGSGSNALFTCSRSDLTGQDGQVGRDSDPATSTYSDGSLGFVFTKVCNSGAFAGSGSCPANPVPGPDEDDWGCTYDNVTQLTWEVKALSGFRSAELKYTNYSPDYDPVGEYRGPGDAAGYIDRLNSTGLCGAKDWAIEHVAFRQSLVHYGKRRVGQPRLDTDYFPTMKAGAYWTTAKHSPDAMHAWALDFADGSVSNTDTRDTPHHVHAVRRKIHNEPGARFTFSADGTEVQDNNTNTSATWRRCVEGSAWDGAHCIGSPLRMTHEQALLHAAGQAQLTGVPWRLPNIKELTWIIERDRFNPALVPSVWVDASSEIHWTSTPEVAKPSRAWTVDFEFGASSTVPRTEEHVVRLVRTSAAGQGK